MTHISNFLNTKFNLLLKEMKLERLSRYLVALMVMLAFWAKSSRGNLFCVSSLLLNKVYLDCKILNYLFSTEKILSSKGDTRFHSVPIR